MLMINLLPWREREKCRQVKILKMASGFSLLISCTVLVWIHHCYEDNLVRLHDRIVKLENISRKLDYPNDNTFNDFIRLGQSVGVKQQNLQAVFNAMFLHPDLTYQTLELQKNVVKITGYSTSISSLMTFISTSEKKFHFKIKIKQIKDSVLSGSIAFQLYINQ